MKADLEPANRQLVRPPASRHCERVGKLWVFFCFAALFALGVNVYRDYGFYFDENIQRVIGAVTVKHVVERFAPSLAPPAMALLPKLDDYSDRDYGVAFEAPTVVLEGLLGLTDKRDIYFLRHFLTFLVCLGGMYAVYCLAHRRFADRRIGLLAVAFLVLSPRLFAESFYNSKDTVLMAAFAIALNTTIAFVLKPRPGPAVLHALATAFAVDVRIAAIILPMATIALLAVRIVKREVNPRPALSALAIYLATMAVFVVAMWPWLWADPLGRFMQALASMSSFRWEGDVLYMGTFFRGTDLPWHYIPVWISITTPLLYLVLFLVGAALTCRQIVTSFPGLWKDEAELQDVVFLGMFGAPVGAVIVLHPVLYDGWRHLYFVYPSLLMVAVRGWHALWSGTAAARIRRPALAALTAISFAVTTAWMWRAHPLQNVYFNLLAGTDLKARYDLDYWGLSARRGLEYVLAHDGRDDISIRADSFMELDRSIYLLTLPERSRLQMAPDEDSAEYLFTDYRWVRDTSNAKYQTRYDLFYEVKVDDEVILSVFKRKP